MSVSWEEQQKNDIKWYKNHVNKNIALMLHYDYFSYVYDVYCKSIHGIYFTSAIDIGISDTGGYLSVIPAIGKRVGYDPAVDILRKMDMLPLSYHIRYVRGYAEKIPFKDNSFPLIILTNALDHFKDMEQSVKEIMRIMRPGGYMLFTTFLNVKKPHPFTFHSGEEVKQMFPELKVIEEHLVKDKRPFNRRSDAYIAIFQK